MTLYFLLNWLLDRLEKHYDFQCEGGPLFNCIEWQLLRALIPRGK